MLSTGLQANGLQQLNERQWQYFPPGGYAHTEMTAVARSSTREGRPTSPINPQVFTA